MKILKGTVTKKVIVCYYNLGEENFLKVAAFVIFPTSVMVLFEIHQRFEGHFLKELRVSFDCRLWEFLVVLLNDFHQAKASGGRKHICLTKLFSV